MFAAFEPHLEALNAKQEIRCQNIRRERSFAHGRTRTSNQESRRHVPCRGVSHNIIEELADSPSSPFYNLGLMEHRKAGGYDGALRRQVVQLRHLKADPRALALHGPPDWPALFSDCSRPLVVDLGCGAGRCMLAAAVVQEAVTAAVTPRSIPTAELPPAIMVMPAIQGTAEAGVQAAETGAKRESCLEDVCLEAAPGRGQWTEMVEEGTQGGCGAGANFLGVEVRLALASRANAWAQQLRVSHRLAFMCANANASLVPLLQSYGGPTTSQRYPPHTTTPPPPSPDAAHTFTRAHGALPTRHGSDSMCGVSQQKEGRVRLVCLQFSDPSVRREALLGDERLVDQLAGALQPGALIWIQSDVSSIACSLRRLFWRNGGFAPSIRHAAARGITHTRHWLPKLQSEVRPQPPSQPSSQLPPHPPSPVPAWTTSYSESLQLQPSATQVSSFNNNAGGGCGGYGKGISMAGNAANTNCVANSELSDSSEFSVAAGSVTSAAAMRNGAVQMAVQHADLPVAIAAAEQLPLLLLEADLATHQEPWLTDKQVAVLAAARRAVGRNGDRQPQEEGMREVIVTAGPQQANDDRGGDDEAVTECKKHLVNGEAQIPEGDLASSGMEEDGWAGLPWLDANPVGVPTEREVYVERGGRPIYRLLLVRR